jgi:hypothetical protein
VETGLATVGVVNRGFSSRSPLSLGLAAIYAQQAIRSTAILDSSARLAFAPADAEVKTKEYGAAVDLFNNQQGQILASEGNQVKRQVGILQAAARMVGSISSS